MPIDSELVLLLMLCDDDDAMRSPAEQGLLAMEQEARRKVVNEDAEKANEAGTPKRLVHAKVVASTQHEDQVILRVFYFSTTCCLPL